MTTLVVVSVGVLMLMFLVMTTQGVAPVERQEEEAPPPLQAPPTLQKRVERLIGILNYGDQRAVQDATRQLLSMGTGVLPALLNHLLRLEQRPGALSAACQLRLEELLADFGLQTWLQTADAVHAIHRASPVLPAMTRVLTRIGPNLLVELARGPTIDPVGLGAPLLARLGPDVGFPLLELLRARPEQTPASLLLASLPVMARHPEVLDQLLDALDTRGQSHLMEALAPWPLPGQAQRLQRLAQGQDPALQRLALEEALLRAEPGQLPALLRQHWALEDPAHNATHALLTLLEPQEARALLRTLDDPLAQDTLALLEADAGPTREAVERALEWMERPEQADRVAGVLLLSAHWEDPRAGERLVALANDGTDPRGALALGALCRVQHEAFADVLLARLRSAQDRPPGRLAMRCAAARAPQSVEPHLLRALRAESPRIASLAALLLAPRALPAAPLLKAMGRHRYSPCEPLVAPLLWARWPSLVQEVVDCLDSGDREVSQAAVVLLGGLGHPDSAPGLLGALEREQDDPELILNALEMLGPPVRGALLEFAQQHPEFSRRFALSRRAALLEQLGQAQA